VWFSEKKRAKLIIYNNQLADAKAQLEADMDMEDE